MARLSLVLAAVIAVIAAVFAPAPVARAQQGPPRFEYLQVTPHGTRIVNSPGQVDLLIGYRACAAAGGEWRCREFVSSESSGAEMFSTLGDEGWELVSALDVRWFDENRPSLTYLFKRQR
jgi:hypothetical protein